MWKKDTSGLPLSSPVLLSPDCFPLRKKKKRLQTKGIHTFYLITSRMPKEWRLFILPGAFSKREPFLLRWSTKQEIQDPEARITILLSSLPVIICHVITMGGNEWKENEEREERLSASGPSIITDGWRALMWQRTLACQERLCSNASRGSQWSVEGRTWTLFEGNHLIVKI